MRWWFKISVRQRSSVSPSERISSTSSFLHPTMALSRSTRATFGILGQVDVAHRLLGQPRSEKLVVRIAVAQPQQDAFMAALVEAFVAGEQELADPIERIGLSTAMAERLVLDAPAHLVDAAVGDSDHVKGIGDPDGMVEVRRGARAIALGEVGGDHPDGSHPGRVLVGAPSAQVRGGVALDQIDHPLAIQIHQAGHVDGVVLSRRREERGLVDAEGPDPLERFGSSTSGVPCSTTASITVHQQTPSSRATTATGRASSPTWRVASAPARSVSTAPGATCSVPSVHVLAAQSGSTQRHRRFSQTRRAGRPKQGPSKAFRSGHATSRYS